MSTAGPSIIHVQHITIFKGSTIDLRSNTAQPQRKYEKLKMKTARIRGNGVILQGRGGQVAEAPGNMNMSTKASL